MNAMTSARITRKMAYFRNHFSASIGADSPFHLPETLQCVGNFGGHVVFVKLGKNIGGVERAVGLQPAFADNALSFAEQVGQQAHIADGGRIVKISNIKAGLAIVAGADTALGDNPAQADRLAFFDRPFRSGPRDCRRNRILS